MNKLILNLTLTFTLFSLLSSCGTTAEKAQRMAEQDAAEIDHLQALLQQYNLPNLVLAYQQNNDPAFLVAADSAIRHIAGLRGIDSQKLSISTYIKAKDLTEQILGYTYHHSTIVQQEHIPERIISSFNRDFKCTKPEKNSPFKQITTLVFNREEADIRVSVEEWR